MSFAIVLFGPITVVPHRDKANPFRRSSILFRPRSPPNERGFGGAAGYRPRVRSAYYERVYVHSPEGHPLYRQGDGDCKDGKSEGVSGERRCVYARLGSWSGIFGGNSWSIVRYLRVRERSCGVEFFRAQSYKVAAKPRMSDLLPKCGLSATTQTYGHRRRVHGGGCQYVQKSGACTRRDRELRIPCSFPCSPDANTRLYMSPRKA